MRAEDPHAVAELEGEPLCRVCSPGRRVPTGWPMAFMVRRKAVLGRYTVLRCLWHEATYLTHSKSSNGKYGDQSPPEPCSDRDIARCAKRPRNKHSRSERREAMVAQSLQQRADLL
eukprot:2345532-Prymnesium_polylepis.1